MLMPVSLIRDMPADIVVLSEAAVRRQMELRKTGTVSVPVLVAKTPDGASYAVNAPDALEAARRSGE